jgi:[acyl-carrier-protein] S-malonyltransferase
MGKALASVSAAAAGAWQEADDALGEPISVLAWEGPAEQLDLTVNAQPALLAASIAAQRALDAARGPGAGPYGPPGFYAGHSMGQYSAMVAAGVISLGDGVRLVRERGRLMQASSGDGAMAAILGLPDERAEELIAAGAPHGVVSVANRNSPGQIVISGTRVAVEASTGSARSLGAKRAKVLPVSVAAHSPLMAEAAFAMREVLGTVDFATPSTTLLANADARPLTTGDACRTELVDHLTAGVDWVRAVETMVAAGVDTFIEVGPGRVLTGLTKRIAPTADVIAVDDPSTPDRLALPFAAPSPGDA